MLRRCHAVIKACGCHNQCRYVGHPCVPHMTVYTFQVDSQRYCFGHVHSKPLPWPLRLVLLVSCLPVLLLNQCQVFFLIFVVVGVFFGGFCSFLEGFFKSMYIFICRDMIEFYHFIKLSGYKGNVLCNDALNTFYLRLYGVRHMVNDHSDSERGNPLPPHWLLFPISSKGSFICTIPQTG